MASTESRLWTNFFVWNDARIHPSVISWSKSVPIRFYVDIDDEEQDISEELVEFVCENVHRMQNLTFSVSSGRAARELISDIDKPAPLLRVAKLLNYTVEEVPPSHQLLEHTSHLRTLHIHSWHLDWEDLVVSHLTELAIITGDDPQPLPMSTLRNICRTSRCCLFGIPSYWSAHYDGEHIPISDQIHLPHLRFLELANFSVEEDAFLMNLLRLPSARLEIHFYPLHS